MSGVSQLCQRLRVGHPSGYQALIDAVRGTSTGEAFAEIVKELCGTNLTSIVVAAGIRNAISSGVDQR